MDLSDFENESGIDSAFARALRHLEPPPNLKPSEWAEASVHIPAGNAVPGPMRMANAPYQREPMDMAINPDCRRITLMWGAQVGKTMLALCVQGYFIEVQPSNQMMMQPSQGDLTTWLETKFNPLVDANDKLRNLIAKPRGREGVNNQRMKSFPGGFLMFAWSGSPKTMRGRSAPKIVCDEVDGYERTDEGHPVGLLWQRAATFGDQRLLLEISTPTVKDESYIEKAYEAGDQRQFYVACPHCGHAQTLKWEMVRWEGRLASDEENLRHLDAQKPETAEYVCESCGVVLSDGERIAAIRSAESIGHGWKAAKPFRGHASYHLNELYSTFRRLQDIVQSYLEKLATDDLQTFINVSLAKTWEVQGDKADPHALMQRREQYAAQVPMGGVWLGAGIDAQIDRLEVQIVAFGVGEESWRVDYRVLWGDPLAPDVWIDLEEVLNEEFQHESGTMLRIGGACIDTGGTNSYTQTAYDWLRGKTGRRIFGVKGVAGWGRTIVERPQKKQSGKNARKADIFLVGVDEAKTILMRRLNMENQGPGFVHFSDDADQGYFEQLTAEKLVTRYVKGFPVREWHKPDKARNEALDTFVYAYAALKIMQPNLKRLAERLQTHQPIENRAKIVRNPIEQPKIAENDNEPAQNPQEEQPAPRQDNAPIVRSKRALNARKGMGTWATKW